MQNTLNSLLLLLLISVASSVNAITLTFAYEDKAQPPYYMGNTNQLGQIKPGVAVEMLQLLTQGIDDLQIKFVRMPWKRALYSLKNNRVDGVFNASYKKERLAFGWYPTTNLKHDGPIDTSRRITNISYSLYKLKTSSVNWQGQWQDLNGQLVGAPLGYSIVSDLQKQGIQVEESDSTLSNLRMLTTRRLKLVALQTVTADSALNEQENKHRYNAIEKLTPPLISKPYYLMLSNRLMIDHPVLAQGIWDEIKLIREAHMPDLLKIYQD